MFDRTLLFKAKFEFVIISDTHYMLNSGPKKVEFASRQLQTARTEYAFGLVASLAPSFVVHLGDLVQEFPETAGFEQAMLEAHAQLNRYGLQPKLVAGNHDVGDKPDPTMPTDWVTPASLAHYHAQFGCSWYSWDAADIHCMVLDSQIFNSTLSEAEQQRQWLETDLQTHTAKRIFIFLHLAPFLESEQEPALGHYDNIDQPARARLLDLLCRYRVELMFAGRSHFAFFNRVGEARFFVAASTSFTRPGFSEMFSSDSPPEQGRDDIGKLGFYLIRVCHSGTNVHFIRTGGKTAVVSEKTVTPYLVTCLSRDLPYSPLGLVLRHPLAWKSQVPSVWPSVIRQSVRNDYPLLACTELGARHVHVPASDFADTLQSQRLAVLRDEGVRITATWLWSDELDFVGTVQHYQGSLDFAELQILGMLWPDEACLHQLKLCQTEVQQPVALSPVIPRERVPGKQHFRTRLGYRVEELPELNRRLAQAEVQLNRVLCRVDTNAQPWDVLRQACELGPLTNITAIDWLVELATTNEQAQILRAAEAMFAASLLPESRLFLEPLLDLDRTMDVSYGLLDRRCNPRPVFQVVRCLNTILFASPETRRPLTGPNLSNTRILGITGDSTILWLILPGQPLSLDLQRLDSGHLVKCFYLEQGTSQTLEGYVNTFPLAEATLLVFRP